MEIKIKFGELGRVIQHRSGKSLFFSRISDKKVRVAYEQSILVGTVKVPVNVTVDAVGKDSLLVSYDGMPCTGVAVPCLLKYLQGKNPELNEALVKRDGQQLYLMLSRLPGLRNLFASMSLKDIRVDEDCFVISAVLE